MLLLLAAWQDCARCSIADGFSLGIVAIFVVWAHDRLSRPAPCPSPTLALALACAAGMFGAGHRRLSRRARMGGGDVKLAAAASLFAGPALILDFLTVTAMVGGLLGVAILAGARIGPVAPTADCTVRARLRGDLPYGPAIAAGGLWVALAARLDVTQTGGAS